MRAPRRIGWAPPFLVGACAAIAAEVALGILLYAGVGLMRSLTTVLAVEGIALGVGLWSAPPPGAHLVDGLRRRWLLCLLAFLAAATYGTAWSLMPGIGQGRADQAIGLALLAGFPLFTCGTVLGGLSASTVAGNAHLHRSSGVAVGSPGAAAAIGAAVGFAATGLALPRLPIPASLLVGCLVMLSAAGMLYGIFLSANPSVELRATLPTPGGEARVEDRRTGADDPAVRYLLEAGHVRGRLEDTEDRPDPWDVTLARAVAPGGPVPWTVLMVGGIGSPLPRTVLAAHPEARVRVLERSRSVVELAQEWLPVGVRESESDRFEISVGHLEDLLLDTPAPFDLVVVDLTALAPLGGVGALSRGAHARLRDLTAGSGAIAWGPLAPGQSVHVPEGRVAVRLRPEATPLVEAVLVVHPERVPVALP